MNFTQTVILRRKLSSVQIKSMKHCAELFMKA